jgi:hypothetical protein
MRERFVPQTGRKAVLLVRLKVKQIIRNVMNGGISMAAIAYDRPVILPPLISIRIRLIIPRVKVERRISGPSIAIKFFRKDDDGRKNNKLEIPKSIAIIASLLTLTVTCWSGSEVSIIGALQD